MPSIKRRRAQRVEALLDDGGADVLAARVVAVVDGEQRPAGGDGGGRQRPLREVADARDERRRQAAADLGADVAVGMLEEDRGRGRPRTGPSRGRRGRTGSGRGRAGCRCRSRRGAAPRPDGAGARPRRPAGAPTDDRAERVGGDPGDLEVERPERAGGLADDVEDAPRLARAGDRRRPARAGHRAGPRADRSPGSSSRIPGIGARPVRSPAGGERQGLAEDPEPSRAGRRGGSRRRASALAHGTRGEAVAAGLPDGHEVMAVGVADERGRRR